MKILLIFLLSFSVLSSRTIVGTVYDSFTNEPVPDVKIIINNKEGTIYTDKNGKFEIEVSKKTHTDFIKSGYVEKHINLTPDFDNVWLSFRIISLTR